MNIYTNHKSRVLCLVASFAVSLPLASAVAIPISPEQKMPTQKLAPLYEKAMELTLKERGASSSLAAALDAAYGWTVTGEKPADFKQQRALFNAQLKRSRKQGLSRDLVKALKHMKKKGTKVGTLALWKKVLIGTSIFAGVLAIAVARSWHSYKHPSSPARSDSPPTAAQRAFADAGVPPAQPQGLILSLEGKRALGIVETPCT